MNKKIFAGIFAVLTVFVLTFSCKKNEAELAVMQTESVTNKQPMSVGEAHNFLLEKAYSHFGDQLRSTSSSYNFDIMAVVDYWATLEEVNPTKDTKAIEGVKRQISDLYQLCRERNVKDESGVLECLDILLAQESGNALSVSKLTASAPELRALGFSEHQDIFNDVAKHSEQFWTAKHGGLRASNNKIILSDAAGAAWGLFLGPVGSIFSGAAASLIVENAKEIASGYDWRANPKWI